MKTRRTRLLASVVAALLVVASAAVFSSDRVAAAVPTLKGPAAVFTLPSVPISFSGTDLISHEPMTITTTAGSTGDCDATADPPVLDGCGSVQLSVTQGKLSYDPSGVDPTTGSPSGQGALQFAGTNAALNKALATLVYTPALGFENLPSSPTYLTVNSTDGQTGDSTSAGSPDQSLNIEIRVAPPNLLPTTTTPPSPQHVQASSDTTIDNNQFSVADPDLQKGTPEDQRMLIMWTTCGTFDLDGGSFTVGPDIKNLLNNQVGLDPQVTNAIYNSLPSAVKNLPTSTSETDVSALVGVGDLTDINDALSTVIFHAPASAGTCTLHQLVDDLGYNGLPGSYVNLTHNPGDYPTGIELPAMGFAESSVDFVVAGGIPTVTINQGATQADPTSVSPILFDVVFNEPVTGFDESGVDLSGTAGATTAVVTGSGADYTVSVSGMTQDGTVIATVPAGAATGTVDPVEPSAASTSTDNVVTYMLPAPPTTTTTTVPDTTTTTTPPVSTTTSTVPDSTTTTSTTLPVTTTTSTTLPVTTTTSTTLPVTTTTSTTVPATTTTTEPATTTTTVAATTTTVAATTSTTAVPATTSTTVAGTATTSTTVSGGGSTSSSSGTGGTTSGDPGTSGGSTTSGSGVATPTDPSSSSSSSSSSGGDPGSLPVTGVDVAVLLGIATVLIATGVLAVIVGRRRARD